jgi:3-oxoacyl-[acyl-carrier protein] reductase
MTVVITGAGSPIGIGRAVALGAAARGEAVVLVDIDGESLERTAAEIERLGVDVLAVRCDVSETTAVDAAIAEVLARFGTIDTLVANAGIVREAPFVAQTDELWALVMETNLGGARRMARAVVPAMLAAGHGSIVFTSSHMGSARAWADHVPYSASKAAIEGLTRALALELAPRGIRVNAVAPGFVRTNQLLDPVNSAGEEGAAELADTVPLGRLGRPEDIANLIEFLASERAAYITGQTVLIDGGINLG